MVVELASKNGELIRPLFDVSLDTELNGGEYDFSVNIPLEDYKDDLADGNLIVVAGSEIGGVIGKHVTNTADKECVISGYTWRGLMFHKVISPQTVSGELNTVLRNLFSGRFGNTIKVSTESTGKNISYTFDSYTDLLHGVIDMLKSVKYRMQIVFKYDQPNIGGYVEVSAVPIVDHSSDIELSQDSKLNFIFTNKKNGINHLVCIGKDEILNLYADANGRISTNQYYFGIDEIADVFEATSSEGDELRQAGEERLAEIMNSQTFEMDIEQLNIDISIGDILGGRDQVSGNYMSAPINQLSSILMVII